MSRVRLPLLLALTLGAANCEPPQPPLRQPPPSSSHCCAGRSVVYADCWGFAPGADSTAALQAAIDCGASTVVVRDMGAPWIVSPQHEPDGARNATTHARSVRAAINFTSPNQLVIFAAGSVVEAKRWSFHGMNDNLAFIGSDSGPVHNITIRGTGAVWRMHKKDYQCTPCPGPHAGSLPCSTCAACLPESYDATRCYAKSEQRHGLNIWCGVSITVTGLKIEWTGGDGIMTGGLERGTAATRTRNVSAAALLLAQLSCGSQDLV
eukprot:SAG22_NODE_1488_length_4314_cov_7.901779_1_plen_265_part_00